MDMSCPKARNNRLQAPLHRTPGHKPASSVQAIDIQSILHRMLLALGLDFADCDNREERRTIALTISKTTDAWRAATAERREILGKPRAGQLSPAERAAMRQRKSNRDGARRSRPSVTRKESLFQPGPSGRSGEAEGAACGRESHGVTPLSVLPASGVPVVAKPGAAVGLGQAKERVEAGDQGLSAAASPVVPVVASK